MIRGAAIALAASLRGRRPACEYCGRRLNGHTYVLADGLHFCSEHHYLAWLNERGRWDDESGQDRWTAGPLDR